MSFFEAELGRLRSPVLVIDRPTMMSNLAALQTAAGETPLRIASKSVRVRGVIEWAASQTGICGILAYSAAEALWLAQSGLKDILIAYPTVDKQSIQAICADQVAREEITFIADLPAHLDILSTCAKDCEQSTGVPVTVKVAADIDSSLAIGPFAVGAHRSSIRSAEQATAFGEAVRKRPYLQLVGAMFYEAQVAGVPDSTPVHRGIKKLSMIQLRQRRQDVVDALSAFGDLTVINGGGTGSAHLTNADGILTDIAVGSGLFTSVLFDGYRNLKTRPAAYFVSPVVRKPLDDVVVTFSGGYVASGPAGRDRVPKPVYPEGLRYFASEGSGEVQTPMKGSSARDLEVGDHVWFRHAKAGEVCERFEEVLFIEDGHIVDRMPTYRGEGKNFG